MFDETQPRRSAGATHETLAHRLFQLATDTDRVGLHGEAIALASFAASVLQGRRVVIRDA